MEKQDKKRKVIKMTEGDFDRVLSGAVNRIVEENRQNNEIRHAQRQLYSLGNTLSQIGLTLEGTPFEIQWRNTFEEIKKLNDMMIQFIRNNKTA